MPQHNYRLSLFVLLFLLMFSLVSAQEVPEVPEPVTPFAVPEVQTDADGGPIIVPAVEIPLTLDGTSAGTIAKTGAILYLSGELNALVQDWQNGVLDVTAIAADYGPQINGNLVRVTITTADVTVAADAVQAVTASGGVVAATFQRWVDAWVPVGTLADMVSLPNLVSIDASARAYPLDEPQASVLRNLIIDETFNTGSVVTEGVVASNADAWHAAGYTGQGLRIGVLDSFADYQTAQSLGELPADIQTLGTLRTSSPHGTAVAEIIYDMAPGVTFTFASPNSTVEMASYIEQMAQNGHKVISSSMGFLNAAPGDGAYANDPIATAIKTAHNQYGTLYVQAAGNQATYNWQGQFRDTDNDGIHEWDANGAEINILQNPFNVDNILPQNFPLILFLRWNDWHQSDQDYDLYVYLWNGSSWDVAIASEGAQSGSQSPTESIAQGLPAQAVYGIVISNYSADGSHILDIMGANAPDFEFNLRERSLVDEATPLESFAVAALDVNSPFTLEDYSSAGPTLGPGGSLATGNDQPRIAGFANVNTWSYGTDPTQGKFNGTSSATPHVSGAAAVVLSAFPNYTPSQLKDFLEGRAVDMGSTGYDHDYGMGRLFLGDPPSGGANTVPVATDDSYSTNQDTALNVTAANGVLNNDTDADGDPLTAAVVSNVSNGTLSLSTDGSFTYTPNTGFTGTDSFTYQANDGTDNSNMATVTISVQASTPGNQAPVANNDSYSTNQDTALNVTAANGVLNNDTDADGDPLTTGLVDSVMNGNLTLNGDGSFTYTPNTGFTGMDSFTYHASDGTDASNIATVTIAVQASSTSTCNANTAEDGIWCGPSGTVTMIGNPTYEWVAQPGSTAYEIYVGPSNGYLPANYYGVVSASVCSNGVCSVDLTTQTSNIPGAIGWLLSTGQYAVFINPDPGNLAMWSGPYEFIATAPQPTVPTMGTTTGTNTTRPTINWTLTGNAAYSAFFQLYLAPTNNLIAPVLAVPTWVTREQVCGTWDGTTCSYTVPFDLQSGQEYALYMQSWGMGGMSTGGLGGAADGWVEHKFTMQ